MKTDIKKNVLKYYETGYKKKGANYQRKYPNEEFCRFMGRHFFNLNKNVRRKKKILEVGCGTGGNLCMIANEGFKTYGLDFSKESILILKNLMRKRKLKAQLKVANMIQIPFEKKTFDCVADIFSSTHLNKIDGEKFIGEASRVLKKGGLFFSYFPSKKSHMFRSKRKRMIDKDTIFKLNNVKHAYKISSIPFRFMSKKDYTKILKKNNFRIIYMEEILKTYFKGKEKFVFIIAVGKKTC